MGFCPGDYESSPKYHCQLVGEPVLVSVKFTVSGAGPESGYGGGGMKKMEGGVHRQPPHPLRPGPNPPFPIPSDVKLRSEKAPASPTHQ